MRTNQIGKSRLDRVQKIKFPDLLDVMPKRPSYRFKSSA